MSSPNPVNMAAVQKEKGQPFVIEERPMPTLKSPTDVIVRVHAVAINPADHIRRDIGMFVPSYPTVLGMDSAGVVEAVGSGVTVVKPGDRVSAFGQLVEHEFDPMRASFQRYLLANEVTCARIPDSMSYRDAATIPLAHFTSNAALFVTLGLPKPVPAATGPDEATKKQNARHGILIWSGATSIGTVGVQIAAGLGYTVYVTASTKHHAYLRKLGAAKTWDYHSTSVAADILAYSEASGVPVAMVYDCAPSEDAWAPCCEILDKTSVKTHVDGKSPKKYAVARLLLPDHPSAPEGIEARFVNYGEADTVELCRWMMNEYIPPKLADGSLVASPPVRVWDGGLAAIGAALDFMKEGNVSGEKIVLDIE